MAMQGIYRVEGRNEVFVLEDDKWRYVCTEAVLFQAGYSWDDVQVIPVAEWCKYEVGYPMPGGWADPSNYGYFPHRDFYIQACAVAPPPPPPPPTYTCPHCGATLGSQAELDAHIASTHPSPPPPPPPPVEMPRILYGAGSGVARQCAEIGINVILMTGFYELTYSQRDAELAKAAQYGVKVMPWLEGIGCYKDPNQDPAKSETENWWDEKAKFLTKYKDDERIYGWDLTEEPELTDWQTAEWLKDYYNFVRKYDPAPGKPGVILWDQWDATGHRCQDGQYDLTTMDTWYSGGDNVEGFRSTIRHLDGYYRWRDIGKPAIAHFYGYTKLAECYQAWQDFFGERGVEVIGTMYYNGPIVMGNTAEAAAKRAAVEQFHRSLGWAPEPQITIGTLTHACGAKIEYQVSPVVAHNIALACPYDGASLGVNGISGSAVITNIDEMASKLQGEIAALDNKIAELQGRIETLRVQVAEATEIIGV